MKYLSLMTILCMLYPLSAAAGGAWSRGVAPDDQEFSSSHHRASTDKMETELFVKRILARVPEGYSTDFLYLCTQLKPSVNSKEQMQELMLLLTQLKPDDYNDKSELVQAILERGIDWNRKVMTIKKQISLWNRSL